MELLAEVWTELLEIVQGFSTPVKIGWPVLILWVMVQIAWYRYGRSAPKVVPRAMPASRRPTPRPSTGSKPIPALRAGASPEFLAALGLDQPAQPETPVATPGLTDLSTGSSLTSSKERSAYGARRDGDEPSGSVYR